MKKTLKRILSSLLLITVLFNVPIKTHALSLHGPMDGNVWNDLKTYYNTFSETGYNSIYFDLPSSTESDTGHGWEYSRELNKNTVLNQYTSGIPVAGTRVSTWTNIEGEPTQVWLKYKTDRSDRNYYLVPHKNRDTFLEIYRTSSSSTTPLIARIGSYQNNYYEDGHIHEVEQTRIANSYRTVLQLPSRTTNNVTYNQRTLNKSSEATPVSDGVGRSYWCVWDTANGYWFVHDGYAQD